MCELNQISRPVFVTRRLVLRPRTLADTDACLAMDREPEVTRFVNGPWSDPVEHRAFIEQRTLGPYPPGLGYWSIGPREEPGRFLGWVLLIPADAVGPEIEVGWRLCRKAWGQGIATEATRPVLDYGCQVLMLPEVIAEIDPDNLASVRVAEKLRLRLKGVVQSQGRPAQRYSLKCGDESVSRESG